MSEEEIQSTTEDRLARLHVVDQGEIPEVQAETPTEIPPADFGSGSR